MDGLFRLRSERDGERRLFAFWSPSWMGLVAKSARSGAETKNNFRTNTSGLELYRVKMLSASWRLTVSIWRRH